MKNTIQNQLLLFALIISALAPPVQAESTTYSLDELGITIEIPSELPAFTRDITQDHPGLQQTTMSKEEVLQSMIETNTYLEVPAENWGILYVTMTDLGKGNMDDLTDFELEQVIKIISENVESDTTYLRCDYYQHKQEKFLKFYWSVIESLRIWDPKYILQYYTLHSGKAINIYFCFTDGEIDAEREVFARSIIDSIVFYEESGNETDNNSSVIDSNMRNVSFALYFFVVSSLVIILYIKRKKLN